MDQDHPEEEELKHRQGAALYPVGRSLRTTFDADEALQPGMTQLMLQLAHLPYPPDGRERTVANLPPVEPSERPSARTFVQRTVARLFGR